MKLKYSRTKHNLAKGEATFCSYFPDMRYLSKISAKKKTSAKMIAELFLAKSFETFAEISLGGICQNRKNTQSPINSFFIRNIVRGVALKVS